MRYRESGMPSEQLWDTFFDPQDFLEKLGVNNNMRIAVDIGCGYGTFLFPIAEVVKTKVIGIDIDKKMIKACRKKIENNNILKINLIHGDISTTKTLEILGEYKSEIDYVTLFNILHCEEPLKLLKNAYQVLSDNGKIGVIHWKQEETPRGPSMEIRPQPKEIINWAIEIGFRLEQQVELPPYHFGIVFVKDE